MKQSFSTKSLVLRYLPSRMKIQGEKREKEKKRRQQAWKDDGKRLSDQERLMANLWKMQPGTQEDEDKISLLSLLSG